MNRKWFVSNITYSRSQESLVNEVYESTVCAYIANTIVIRNFNLYFDSKCFPVCWPAAILQFQPPVLPQCVPTSPSSTTIVMAGTGFVLFGGI